VVFFLSLTSRTAATSLFSKLLPTVVDHAGAVKEVFRCLLRSDVRVVDEMCYLDAL